MRSTFPLMWGWYGAGLILLTPHSLEKFLKRSFSNSVSRSSKCLSGKPNLSIRLLYNHSAADLALILAVGYACKNPVK